MHAISNSLILPYRNVCGVHISAAGCTIFGVVHPECALFFVEILSLLHIRRVHGENLGCTVLVEVHPMGAQNKTLISDTALTHSQVYGF